MIKWSFSGLKEFSNCPKQYQQVKVLQNFTKKITSQMTYGTDVHKALEEYARDGKPLPEFYKSYKRSVDELLNIPGTRYLEHKMALKDDRKTPCAFDAPEYWVRGIVDFMVIDGDTAYIVDYKTGSKKYPDTKQLKLMALMTFAHFPQVKLVKAALMFLVHEAFMEETYHRDISESLWSAFAVDLMRLEHSFNADVWPATPTPLCRWCPVHTCQFHKS